MIDLKEFEVWFVTGSQHLYGPKTLEHVTTNSQEISNALGGSSHIPTRVIFKPVLTTPEEIYKLCQEANLAENCVGLITWMHTFSPAKMWIRGLNSLEKPYLHFHTQHNRLIPWGEIDMDFMNLNQAAHGDREFGFISSRMRMNRKVVVGYWADDDTRYEIGIWIRAACGWQDMQGARIVRFGDNMRDVAVTEGDKVEAQIRFGYSVYGHGVGDLVESVNQVTENEIDMLVSQYLDEYAAADSVTPGGSEYQSLREAAGIEIGMRNFLEAGRFTAFTTTFEDLHGLVQLPGLAVQRLMADGYGFGAEGDWKTAALIRAMKVMGAGSPGGTSFMEDYTYHMDKQLMKVLGAHMLEVCPSIADEQPRLDIQPLSIGGKADPARLVFNTKSGPAINASIMDMGNRFRMVVNEVEVVETKEQLPNLPVARALWVPKPDLKVAAAAWILAGGAHHTGFSQALTSSHMQDFAEIADFEFLLINDQTSLSEFKKEIRWNETFYLLSSGF